MNAEFATQPKCIIFGRLRLVPVRRELLVDETPIKLRDHAFDLLMLFIERPGAVLSRDHLLTRVWPDQTVTDNHLHAQISALRQAFGAERDLIRTVSGRGYQFIGEPLIAPPDTDNTAVLRRPAAGDDASARQTNLPQPLTELFGRDADVAEVKSLLRTRRLVTLAGPGGIGKTRLALEIAHQLLPQFLDGVWLVELSELADPELVPAAIAATVGLELSGALSMQRVAQALAARRMLLVLDTCEHVIDVAAAMAEAALRIGSEIQIIATSRELLRADGEQLYQVAPLAVPPEDTGDALNFGAVRLFVDRARAAGADLTLDPSQAAAISAICRRLDGLPLAIEMAAARVAAFGIEELAGRLEGRWDLLTGGRRTALPRHQTLRATLDWSYELLSAVEQAILCRLAVFAGAFSLEAAGTVAVCDEITRVGVVGAVSALVGKSFVMAELLGAAPCYRLMRTTRAYALEKLAESGERESFVRRIADIRQNLPPQTRLEWEANRRPAALLGSSASSVPCRSRCESDT